MFGPRENGFWSRRAREGRGPLELDAEYEVVAAFVDFDGATHPVGERWRFVGSSFLPHDDGLSLFVQTARGEWHLRLKLDVPEQASLWEHFDRHVRRV